MVSWSAYVLNGSPLKRLNGRCELTRDDIDIRHVHGAEVDDVGALLEGESEDVLLGGGAAEPVDADDVLFIQFVTY